MLGALRAGYTHALTINPAVKGRVNMMMSIDATGNVSNARAQGSDVNDRPLLACFESRAKAMRFDAGGQSQPLMSPILLWSGGPMIASALPSAHPAKGSKAGDVLRGAIHNDRCTCSATEIEAVRAIWCGDRKQ